MNVWILLKFPPARGTKQQSYCGIGFYQKTILAKYYTSLSFGKNLSCLYINYAVHSVTILLCFKIRRFLHIFLHYLLWPCNFAVTLYLSLARSKHWIPVHTIEQTDVHASKLAVSFPPNLGQGREIFKIK